MSNRQELLNSMLWAVGIAETYGNFTKAQAEELERIIKGYFYDHWRDDDSPQAEKTLGTRRAAINGITGECP